MAGLDRWLRPTRQRGVATDVANVATLSPPSGDTQSRRNAGKIGDVANVAAFSGGLYSRGAIWQGRRSFPRPKCAPPEKPATTATNGNTAYEIKELDVAKPWRHDGDIGDKSLAFLDFETVNRSGCDLTDAGAWRYAADPATEVLTLVYQNGGGAPLLWVPADGLTGPLVSLVADPAFTFICFGDFDHIMWAEIMVKRFGFPEIPLSRWHNAQAACSYRALPRALGKVLPVIGAEIEKDAVGNRLVRDISKPHKKTGIYPPVTTAVLERVRAYNEIDVRALAAIHAATGFLPERERRVWEMDQAINARGIGIDVEMVHAAKQIAKDSTKAMKAEFAELTGGLTPYQVIKIREWLARQGKLLPNLQETTIADALEQPLPDRVRRVLELRSIVASTALTKLDAMLDCVGQDGRARGLLQYHAATPGRWSGSLLQPQNLPRPTIEIDDPEALAAAIKTGDVDALRPWCGPDAPFRPSEILESALRIAIIARPGHQFGIGDFSMIETCILLPLAGQYDKRDLIASGVDVYRDAAAQIFKLDHDSFLAIAEHDLTLEQAEQRRVGKFSVLGCGYNLGADLFRQKYLRRLPIDEGKRLAEQIVNSYRKEWAPKVPKLWHNLEATARRAMLVPGVAAVAQCGISYRLDKTASPPVLVCTLLNGKEIRYQNARVSPDKTDRRGYPIWTYWAVRKGQWREIEPYGGQLTENVCSALARELLVDAMLRLEERGYPVILTVHDEVVVEAPEITAQIIEEVMTERPTWAETLGVPVSVKAHVSKRYGK